MTYFNERRAVESLLIPLSFIPVVSGGMKHEDAKERDHIILLLKGAIDEAVPPSMNQPTYLRTFKRARAACFDGFLKRSEEKQELAVKIGLALYYFLNNMIEQNAYSIAEGSQLDKALALILPMLEEWLHETIIDREAFEEGQEMLKRLHLMGYFQDVQWVTEFTQ